MGAGGCILVWLIGSEEKNLPTNAGDMGLIPDSGRYHREGNDKLLLYSFVGNPMDRGSWWIIVHGVARELYAT